jgi:hypothetical protein
MAHEGTVPGQLTFGARPWKAKLVSSHAAWKVERSGVMRSSRDSRSIRPTHSALLGPASSRVPRSRPCRMRRSTIAPWPIRPRCRSAFATRVGACRRIANESTMMFALCEIFEIDQSGRIRIDQVERSLTRNFLISLAPRPGLEPGTCGLTVRRSRCQNKNGSQVLSFFSVGSGSWHLMGVNARYQIDVLN